MTTLTLTMAKLEETLQQSLREDLTDIAIYPTVRTLCLGKKCSRSNKGCVLQFMEDTFRWYQASNIQFSFKSHLPHLLETIKRHEMTELEVHINVRPETDLSDRNEMTRHPWAR